MKLSNLAAALAIAGFGLASSSANALIVQDAWGFNISGGSTLSNVGHLGLNGGLATVQQQLDGSGQIVAGSTFTEGGFVYSTNYVTENVPGLGDFSVGLPPSYVAPLDGLQIVFTGLTGTVTSFNSSTGEINYVFNAGVGDVKLQGTFDSGATWVDFATGEIVDPSGGDLANFYGVGNQSAGQSTVVAQFDSFLNGFTFDLFGPGLGFSNPNELFMQVVTTNKISSPAVPCDTSYPCAEIKVTSDGSADLLKVPEPMSLALVGLGLLGIGVVRRRKQLA